MYNTCEYMSILLDGQVLTGEQAAFASKVMDSL